jgi:hypothetical protein
MAMDWLAWVFDISSGNTLRAAMLITFVLSLAFALFLQKWTWPKAALWAAGGVLVVFSVIAGITHGVGPKSPIGFGIALAYLSLVAFPTTGIVRLLMSAARKIRAAGMTAD